MVEEYDPSGPPQGDRLSRRDFLVRTAVSAGVASLVGSGANKAFAAEGAAQMPVYSRVVQIRSDRVIGTRGVHEDLLFDLLEILLRRVTGTDDAKAAWQSILKPDDVIALKFNRSGADGLGTTDPMMRALVRSLNQAGFEPSQIVAVEVSPAIRQETGTRVPASGWSETAHDFGSGRDRLAAWLDEVTAIVNVPFLKNHNIAGITCCLKNLSHALVKHPAQFHANGCSPYIGDIVALPEIRGKLRIHIVNVLRIVFDRGPDAFEDFIWDSGILLGGFDPVALDMIGLQILDRVRNALTLPRISEPDGPPAYLAAAADHGLGTAKLHKIYMDKVKL